MRPITVCALVLLAAASIAPAPARAQPRLSWEPHAYRHAGGEVQAERAMLRVPERHQAPGGKTLELAVVRLKAVTASSRPPIVYLAGGPGSSGIEAGRGARWELFAALREHADVILFDQRGAGHSRPNLNCQEAWGLDPAETRTWPSMTALAWARLEPCLQRLRAEGIDLGAYNTRESAHDVDALRQALGVPAVSLLGISYGTHLGLAVMKYHPAAVSRAVLAGVVGPGQVLKLPSNVDRAFARYSDELQLDAALRRSTPLVDAVRAIVTELAAKPAQVSLERDGRAIPVTVSPFDVRIVLSLAMEDRQTMRAVPALVSALERGDVRPIAAQLAGLVRQPIPTAMNLAMECASGASPARLERIRREEPTAVIGRVIDIPQPGICARMQIPDLGEAFRAPVTSETPVLLISGELDLRTPPENAEEVRAQGLRNAAHLTLARAGHDDDLLVASPELQRAIADFLAGQAARDRRLELPPLSAR